MISWLFLEVKSIIFHYCWHTLFTLRTYSYPQVMLSMSSVVKLAFIMDTAHWFWLRDATLIRLQRAWSAVIREALVFPFSSVWTRKNSFTSSIFSKGTWKERDNLSSYINYSATYVITVNSPRLPVFGPELASGEATRSTPLPAPTPSSCPGFARARPFATRSCYTS